MRPGTARLVDPQEYGARSDMLADLVVILGGSDACALAVFFVAVGLVASLMVAAVPIAQASNGRASFIVVLDDSVDAPRGVAAEHSQAFGADVTHVYRNALKGYSARIDEAQLGALRADKRVAYIERDQVVSIDQSPATWGLDRIDQRKLPLANSFTYTNTGTGVTAYVIDTGIRTRTASSAGARSGFDIARRCRR